MYDECPVFDVIFAQRCSNKGFLWYARNVSVFLLVLGTLLCVC